MEQMGAEECLVWPVGGRNSRGGLSGHSGSKGKVGRKGGGSRSAPSVKEQSGEVRGDGRAKTVQALEGFDGKKLRLCFLGLEESAISHSHFSMNLSQAIAFCRLLIVLHLVSWWNESSLLPENISTTLDQEGVVFGSKRGVDDQES